MNGPLSDPIIDLIALSRDDSPLHPDVQRGIAAQLNVRPIVHRVIGKRLEGESSRLAAIVRDAPLFRLFIAGAALMLTTLIAFSSRTYNAPQDVYVPQSMHDGKLEPGRTIRATEPEPEKP